MKERPMAHDLLGGEDAAWLHMDDATNPMIVNAVLELAAPLPLHQVHALAAGLASKPRFRSRLVAPPLHVGLPSWQPVADFDLHKHVEHVHLASADDDALRALICGAVSKQLDEDLPLWHIHAIERPGAGTTLLVRVHHAVADGFALLGVLLSLCDDGA